MTNFKPVITEFVAKVKPHSNSAFIGAPKSLIGRFVKVIVLTDEEATDETKN